jgi:hypothetical protein
MDNDRELEKMTNRNHSKTISNISTHFKHQINFESPVNQCIQ